MESVKDDLSLARNTFLSGKYTCVLCKDGACYTSRKRGVSPLVAWIRSGMNLEGYSVCDKIVGKAAALMFVLAGIKDVYAQVLSKHGLQVLQSHHVTVKYSVLVDEIVNRQGTGACPMELAVQHIDTPEIALRAIEKRMDELNCQRQTMEATICTN